VKRLLRKQGPNRVIKDWLPCLCVEGRSGHRTLFC
jgi:hypothetical protein